MPGTNDWTEADWQAVQAAAAQTLERTVRHRLVVPRGEDQLGATVVEIRTVAGGPPIAFALPALASPIYIFADLALTDAEAADPEATLRLVQMAAAKLALEEDDEVVNGGPAAPPVAEWPGVPPVDPGRAPRLRGAGRAQLSQAGVPPFHDIVCAAAGPEPDDILKAIRSAVTALSQTHPPPFGLLMNDKLVSILTQVRAGGAPVLEEVRQLGIGTMSGGVTVVPTAVLNGDRHPAEANRVVSGILFALEPPAVDVVWTGLPRVVATGRLNGVNNLRVEQELVVRLTDPGSIQQIRF